MTYIDLVEAVSKDLNIDKAVVNRVVRSFLDLVHLSVLVGGATVKIGGFGRFHRKTRKARMAFGKMTLEKARIAFTPYKCSTEVAHMDKYGVEFDEGLEKQADPHLPVDSPRQICPGCGGKQDGPRHCPKCGTEPWEKRPNKKKES